MALVGCITEMGMGVDVHGLDYTLAAKRAVFDAIHHSSLGFARLVGATADDMIVHVLIGVPHPEKVNADEVAAALPVWSKNSCGFAHVVFQESPKPFTALNRALLLRALANFRKEEHVALILMIPLVMKMRHILRQHMAERRFPEQDQPRQTLLLDRAHPALRVGVQIRRPRWQGHPFHPGRVDDLLKGGAVFSVPV